MYKRWIFLSFFNILMASSCFGEDTCDYIDTCTCEMSDGSGQVNLHSLTSSIPYEEAFSVADGGWTYRYNPCTGFQPNWYWCSYDLAIGQTDSANTYGYDLGIHTNVYFNLTDGSGLSIHYTACDYIRKSRVLLICEPGTAEHRFEVIGELVVLEYDFILTSPCACPGGCDSYGLINPLPPTDPPSNGGDNGGGGGGGGVNIPDNIEVNVNHNYNDDSKDEDSSAFLWTDVGGAMVALIFHDLLLIIVVAAVLIIAKYTSCCSANGDSENSQISFANGVTVAKNVLIPNENP